jgi:hypothetical protein
VATHAKTTEEVAGADGAELWEATIDGELLGMIHTTAGRES